MAKNVFNSVKGLHPRRNSFSAHTYRNDFTSKLGLNIPVYQQHVTAGTRVKCSTSALVRLQALIAPVMDNIDLYVHFWQIPYRLLENDRFTQFFTGEIEAADYDALFLTPREFGTAFLNRIVTEEQESPDDVMSVFANIVDNGSIFDFLGYDKKLFPTAYAPVPGEENVYKCTNGQNKKKFNFRPLIAYYMLHKHWYMNENVPYFDGFVELVDTLIKEQSVNALIDLLYLIERWFPNEHFNGMLPHGWEKDYFTSGLPNVQFGNPVTLSLTGSAPVVIPKQPLNLENGTDQVFVGVQIPDSSPNVLSPGFGYDLNILATDSNQGYLNSETEESDMQVIKLKGYNSELQGIADLSEASAISINELRFANALQVFKERELRFGRRRLEFYKGFFDVVPEDLRLQVPRYLGGGRIPINIADIEQTSSSTDTQALGRLAGKATAVAGGFAGFSTFCSEESIIIGIAFAMPHITYCQATSKFLTKTDDVYDYFNPSFEHLGEQAIEYLEIYSGAGDNAEKEFAYTPRYNEYRFHLNEMHGDFKSSLSYWTLGRIFSSQPTLNASFIYMQPSVFNRIFAVEDSNPMLASFLFRQRIIQPVSKYGTPMLLV